MSDGEFLAKIAAQTGKVPTAVARQPQLSRLEKPYWDAFQVLTLSRSNAGFGPGAIPLHEIIAYTELMQIPEGDERQELLHVIRAMDRSYLAYVSKK